MTGILPLLASFLAGALLGLLFFWGLWLTVGPIGRSPHPALRLLLSLLLRFAMVLAGFYALARFGGWQHLLAAALGFTLLRLLLVQRLQPRRADRGTEP